MIPLTPYERSLIAQDFERIIQTGSEAVVATFEYQHGVPTTFDETYQISGFSNLTTHSVTGKVLQEFLKPRNEKTLSYGILDVHDCILYASTSLNLNIGIPGSMSVIIGNVRWKMIPRNQADFYNYLISRLGTLQVGQVIACKLER